jgi:hypothetical protein
MRKAPFCVTRAIDVTAHFLQKPFALKTPARKIREGLDSGVSDFAAFAASS